MKLLITQRKILFTVVKTLDNGGISLLGWVFHITLEIEFNIYFEKGKFNKTPTVASKMKFSYFK